MGVLLASHQDNATWQEAFGRHGLALFESVIDIATVATLKQKLATAIDEEAALRRPHDDGYQVVCCPYYDDAFLDIAEQHVFALVNGLLGEDCILYNYSNSCLAAGAGNFSSHIHVERYYTSGFLEGVGVMILLDDFTEENGGTLFLLGSQQLPEKPAPAAFFDQAKRLVAPAGSILLFHPHIWHAGGVNHSTQRRDALTLGFCRPYMKQRLNYPVMFAERAAGYSEPIRQKLGFYATSPTSLNEFYA